MGTTPSGSTMATTTTTAPSLHFKIHAYQDLGNRPWVHEHYTVEVPATATLREALALFRANGASSWMGDYELVEHLGLYGVSPPPAEARPSQACKGHPFQASQGLQCQTTCWTRTLWSVACVSMRARSHSASPGPEVSATLTNKLMFTT